ncbi:MAG: ion channel [Thermomicrobiales bacterium]
MSVRHTWFLRLERWTDRTLTVLAIALIPLLLIPFLFDLPDAVSNRIGTLDNVIWAIFGLLLVTTLLLSTDRQRYLRQHWFDIILVVVPWFGPFRAIRALRLFWIVGATSRILVETRRLLVRRGTGVVLVAATFVVLVAAGLIVAAERGEPRATIHTYGDGLWWAMTTFATIGYGDKYPVTPAGHGIAIALMIVGIAAFGLVTANLATLFLGEQEDEAKSRLLEMDNRLRRIESVLLRSQANPASLALLRRNRRNNPNAKERARQRARRRKRRPILGRSGRNNQQENGRTSQQEQGRNSQQDNGRTSQKEARQANQQENGRSSQKEARQANQQQKANPRPNNVRHNGGTGDNVPARRAAMAHGRGESS